MLSSSFLFGLSLALLLAFAVLLYCLYQWRKGLIHHYNIVSHELDDEEIEFKRMIEEQGDDLEELFDIREDDTLDPKDRSRLEMLEQYRTQLVSEVRPNMEGRL